MASDIITKEDDSRRKRHRSPDEEVEESSKRRKHRHHHRSRHHRHRSKRREEDNKDGDEEEKKNGEGDDSNHSPVARSSLPQVAVAPGANLKLDYDMEEGEIVEDANEAFADEFGKKTAVAVRIEPVDQNLGVDAKGSSSYLGSRQEVGHITSQPLENSGHKSGGVTEVGEDKHNGESVSNSTIRKRSRTFQVNGDFSWESRKKCNILSHFVADNNVLEKISPRSRSLSHDSVGDRSRSRSIVKEVSLSENSHGIWDDDMKVRKSRDHQCGSTGLARDDEKESNTTYCRQTDAQDRVYKGDRSMDTDRDRDRDERRYRGRETSRDVDMDTDRDMDGRRYRGRETSRDREKELERRGWGGDMEKREDGRNRGVDNERDRGMDRDRRRDRDRETSRDSDKELDKRARDKSRGRSKGWEKERDSRDREKERERSRDREKERERSRDREKERERSRDRHRSRERVREKERHSVKDNEFDLDRRREKDRDRSRDKGLDYDSQRERRDRGRDVVRETDWERERERDKDRDFVWASEKDSGCDDNRTKGEDRDSYMHYGHGEIQYRSDRTRRNNSEKLHNSKIDSLKEVEEKWKRDEDEQEDYQERISLQLAEQEEEDIDKIKEESRRRRQAILEKYKSKQIQQQITPHSKGAVKDKMTAETTAQLQSNDTASSENFDAVNYGDDVHVGNPSFLLGKSPQNGLLDAEHSSGARGLGEGTPKSERSNDMFCDDIFGDSPAGVRKLPKEEGLPIEKSGIHDNWDDAEGYYSYRYGEILDGRYEITAAHGKGVFSNVVRAKDVKDGNGEPEEVAIKIIRNNETMYKSGQSELTILKKLVGADPDDKRHCVRFLSSFKYRNHLCLVFESLHMNLREVLKKFGRNIGLKLTAVRTYSKQLFTALKHLRNCGVLHCDIKPDNMLVNDAKNVLKLCDFGSAMFAGKNEITPYLVSRFYRAPEIILGLPYDHPLDMWSVGCCLYELYTGKVLFPGPTNSDMLRLHMELKGPFPKKMLRKGGFLEQHFDPDLNFLATEEDPVTKKTIRRMINNIKPKDFGTIITSSPGEDPKMLANFKDLLDKIFVLDPDKRLTVSQALSHPFITGK